MTSDGQSSVAAADQKAYRSDFEKRTQAELSALDLRPARAPSELSLAELVALLERRRARLLSPTSAPG